LEGFTEQEFSDFCMDFYLPVYKEFTTEQMRSRRISILIDYVQSNGEFDKLLNIIHKDKPKQFDNFIPYFVDSAVKTKNKFIQIDEKYTCDRYEHGKSFHEKFLMNSKHPIQFYIIQGKDRQSPEGLIMRFIFEFLHKRKINSESESNSIYERIIVEGYDFEHTKAIFLANLFRNLELPYSIPLSEFSIDKLCRSILCKDKQYIVLQIKIYSNLWDKHYPEFIKWFSKDFCNSQQLPANAPIFLIFWTAVYKDDKKENKSVLSFFCNSKKKDQIKKCFQTISKENIMPELPPVKLQDIEFWLNKLKLDDFGSVTQVVKKYFADEKSVYDMWEVEKGLEKIICDYNAGKIE